MIEWRFATAADIDTYYGERPEVTVRAVVALLDGVPMAIAGLELRGDRAIAFSEFKPEFEPHLKDITVLRAVKAAQRMFRESRLPVIVCTTSNPPLMERLGFTDIQPGVHVMNLPGAT